MEDGSHRKERWHAGLWKEYTFGVSLCVLGILGIHSMEQNNRAATAKGVCAETSAPQSCKCRTFDHGVVEK